MPTLAPVYLAYGIQNTILKSSDGAATWAIKHQNAGSPDCVLDIAWDGATTMVAVGGEVGSTFFVSHDSGDTWTAISTGGRNVRFGFGGFDEYPNGGQLIFWDAATSQFIAVGSDTGANLPVVCTSPDGDTWSFQTVAGQTSGRFLCIAKGTAGIYVAVCWFGGIAGHTTSQIFSSTDLITWTSRYTTTDPSSDRQYPWIKWNGTDFLILQTAGNGNSISSADGIAFTETANSTSPTISPFYGIDKTAIWDAATNKWIVSSLGPLAVNGGIFTASNPSTWATAFSNTHATSAYAGSIVRAGTKLVGFMGGAPSGVTPVAPHLESTDAVTWTPTGPNLDSQYFAVLWDGAQFVGYRTDPAGNNDNQIATSPDASSWTNVYDDASASILNIAVFNAGTSPIPPPPPIAGPTGDLIGFTFNEEQGVSAWHRHPMIGGVEAIACIPNPAKSQDDLWLIVNRVINGVTKRYVEFLAPHFVTGDSLATDAFYTDSGVTITNSPPIALVVGLNHLEGMSVSVLTDGARHPDCVVVGGQITLLWKAAVIQVGLPQVARLTTMPIEAGGTLGQSQGKVARITDLTIRFLNTLGGKVGREDPDKELSDPPETVMDRMEFRAPDNPMDEALPVYNGFWPNETYGMNWPGGSEVEKRITIVNDEPFPMTIVGIYPNLDSED